MSGYALPFPSGQNIQGIALGEIFQSREEQSLGQWSICTLMATLLQSELHRQEGFGVPYLGIAHSLFHWTET